MTRIKTSYDYPPIPCRKIDWSAWDDDLGADTSPIGRGETEQDAIADLLEQIEENA